MLSWWLYHGITPNVFCNGTAKVNVWYSCCAQIVTKVTATLPIVFEFHFQPSLLFCLMIKLCLASKCLTTICFTLLIIQCRQLKITWIKNWFYHSCLCFSFVFLIGINSQFPCALDKVIISCSRTVHQSISISNLLWIFEFHSFGKWRQNHLS